ncbi:MAG: mechanosensitive ion channel family protein [Magnetococcales bacterium]|nr:mechanosensitive ion channel family protein [Magnetococcales bacterium]
MISVSGLLSDLLMMFAIWMVSLVLTRLFPGAVRVSSTERGETHIVEKRYSLNRLMVAVYVLALTFLVHSESAVAFHKLMALPEQGIASMLLIKGRDVEAWILFWAIALFLFLVEYVLRLLLSRHADHVPLPNLLSNLLRWITLFVVAVSIGHVIFKWHIASVVASTTIMTAMLGFALKGMVSDLFSGVVLNMTRAVLPSQWITIPSPRFPDARISGEVISTNLRETRLRSTSGHLYIIPNSHLAGSVIHNMSWPDNCRRHTLHFVLDAGCHPDAVITALESAAATVETVLSEPKGPQAMIVGYTDVGIRYRLRFWSHVYHDKTSTEAKILREVWDRFEAQGLTHPRMEALLGGLVAHRPAGGE